MFLSLLSLTFVLCPLTDTHPHRPGLKQKYIYHLPSAAPIPLLSCYFPLFFNQPSRSSSSTSLQVHSTPVHYLCTLKRKNTLSCFLPLIPFPTAFISLVYPTFLVLLHICLHNTHPHIHIPYYLLSLSPQKRKKNASLSFVIDVFRIYPSSSSTLQKKRKQCIPSAVRLCLQHTWNTRMIHPPHPNQSKRTRTRTRTRGPKRRKKKKKRKKRRPSPRTKSGWSAPHC